MREFIASEAYLYALASPARPTVFSAGKQIELRQRLPVAIMFTP
jgi:hypothetical protein